jgi:uncharacterized protein YprB with RNaseH-like and TPR domain
MPALSERLKNLGVHLGAQDLRPSKKNDEWAIERVISGYDHSTRFGSTFVVENSYPPDHKQGQVGIFADLNLNILSCWADEPGVERINPEEIVFMDTETSGLAGGTGTNIFLIGLGFRTSAGFRLVQLFLRDPSQEQAFLASITAFLEQKFKVVVTFNGKSFDMPLLRSRHILHTIDNPFNSLIHLDLLPLARRLWRNRLPKRSLKDLETEILRMPRTEEEVPGWMVPDIYFDYLKNGDARPLVGVFYHNAMDIVSLAALLNHVDYLLENPLDNPETPALDLAAIARLYHEIGFGNKAITLYDESLKQGLPLDIHLHVLSRAADLSRQMGEWNKALAYWEQAVDFHQIEACVALSKYYEHQVRDISLSIHWAEKAFLLLSDRPKGSRDSTIWGKDLSRRLERLKHK